MSSFDAFDTVSVQLACGCFNAVCLELLAPLAMQAAAAVTGRRAPRTITSVCNTVVPEADPLVDAQSERVLAVLSAVVHCDDHRPPAAVASPATHRRVSSAVLAYLTSSQDHRHTTGRDLLRVLSWSIGDHARQVTAGTPATSRPDIKGTKLRHRGTRNPLLSDAQVALFVTVSRGLMRARGHQITDSGERLAAQIILRLCSDHDALAYVRGVDERTHRGPLTVASSAVSALSDGHLLEELRAFTDPTMWRDGDDEARLIWVWLSTRAREIMGTSLDDRPVGQEGQVVEPVEGVSIFGDPDDDAAANHGELAVLEGVVAGGYRLGRQKFTPKERGLIDARIRQLHDAGFGA